MTNNVPGPLGSVTFKLPGSGPVRDLDPFFSSENVLPNDCLYET
jgi:hypothetical protein